MGKVWFITGITNAIGRSLAIEILEHGGQVVATSGNTEYLKDMELGYPADLLLLPLKIIDSASISTAVDMAINHFGRIDVLVNNVEFDVMDNTEACTDDEINAHLNISLHAPIELSKAVIPYMRKQGSGHIMQISSIGSKVASTGISIYQTADFGLSGFSEALHQEVGPLGITVIAIEPGSMKTQLGGTAMPYRDDEAGFGNKGERDSFFKNGGFVPMGNPDKIARMMTQLVTNPAPPVHLVLGSSAVGILQNGTTIKEKELKQWLNISVSADEHETVNFLEINKRKPINMEDW